MTKPTYTVAPSDVTPEQLRAARAELGLRQVDLAAALGIGRLEISKKEQGIRPVTVPQALGLRALLAAQRLREQGWTDAQIERLMRLP